MPLQATSGAASYDAFGGGVPVAANYIEDVFSTWLYTGNGTTQTITNGIDLAGKGGLVWTKYRNVAFNHCLIDTARGASVYLRSNSTGANVSDSTQLSSFNSSGYTLGDNSSSKLTNESGGTYASWTFRKQPKFFDVVTWTGDGVNGRQIAHNLGSTPGCIIVKSTTYGTSTYNWAVWHRSLTAGTGLALNLTSAAGTGSTLGSQISNVTSTTFTVSSASVVNNDTSSFVAYLFAHNAGGFGLTGTDNVISCGSFTTDGSGNFSVNLGYEPQWVLYKSSGVSSWRIMDNMRGMPVNAAGNSLYPNTADEESSELGVSPAATGFSNTSGAFPSSTAYIYIAIRRGPMKVPTTGTSVFAPVAQNSAGTVTTGFPVDLMLGASRNIAHNTYSLDRLRGSSTTRFAQLRTDTTSAESSGTGVGIGLDNNTGYVDNWFVPSGSGAASGSATAYWNFRRAPGFFDEVCYTGNGSSPQNITHNLQSSPGFIIAKTRSGAANWCVWHTNNGVANQAISCLSLNSTGASIQGAAEPQFTSTTFDAYAVLDVTSNATANQSGINYVAYLFGNCPGVSKCGTYTGTGATQTIDCGFTGGARFVLIKRTNSTGSWFVWDSSRGMVAGTDPRLALNSTAAEANNNWVYTTTGGFQIVTTDASVNANGGNYIYLAIA